MKLNRLWSALGGAAVIWIGAAACSMKPVVQPLPDVSQAKKTELVRSLDNLYPRSYSAVQRIVLQIRNKHYDFLGHLAMSRNEVFRATAFGDMGGKIIDLQAEEGRVELLANPMGLAERPIVSGVVEDIRHVFDFTIGAQSYLVRDEGKALSLISSVMPGQFSEYFFQSEDLEMTSSRSVIEGRLVREVEYESYVGFEGFVRPLPKKIILKNHRWRYELEIELLSISPEIKEIKRF